MKTIERRLARLERAAKPGPIVDEIYLVPITRGLDGELVEGESVLYWKRGTELTNVD